MKISIITPSFNSEKTIEDAIKSVIGQTYKDIEYIIIDGGSKDKTLEIINKYQDKVSKVVSEKDRGLYDAINKGIKLATGEIIGNLNSDDVYENNRVLELVTETFEKTKCDVCWGDLVYVKKDNLNKITRVWKSSEFKTGKFKTGWHPPHPTFFVKREIYEKFGVFRENFKIAADYELMLRLLEKHQVKSSYIPQTLVRMREGGKSNWKSILNVLKANLECYRSFKINQLPVSPFFIFIKPFSKIKQIRT
jgi:glycosyltransferase